MTKGTIRAAAKFFDVDYNQIMARNRILEVVLARNICCLIFRDRDKMKYLTIGAVFGGRDHSTIVHSVKEARKAVEEFPYIAKFVAEEMALGPFARQMRDERERMPPPPPPHPAIKLGPVIPRNEEYLDCKDARMRVHGSFALTRALEQAGVLKISR